MCSLTSHRVEGNVRRNLQFMVLIREDLKVKPFADVIKGNTVGPARSRTHYPLDIKLDAIGSSERPLVFAVALKVCFIMNRLKYIISIY